MKKTWTHLRTLAAGTVALLSVLPLSAQQGSSGNIVAIFGQEKVEKTDEGEVFHHFRDGLLLPGGTGGGSLFNGQDMVAWMYASGNFVTPKAGDSISHRYPAQREAQMAYQSNQEREAAARRAASSRRPAFTPLPQWKWAPIEADSTGTFRNMFMRAAYLYTAYDSPKAQVALLETTGGTRTFVNGYPREGDHYNFGYTLLPVKLNKGLNEIIYTPGRFGQVVAKLVKPDKPVMFTKRDMTLPDLVTGETDQKWAAIRVINATEGDVKDLTIRTTVDGRTAEYKTDNIMPLTVRKVKFKLPVAGPKGAEGNRIAMKVELLRSGKVIDQTEINVRQVPGTVHHERTFVSNIDGSVQYYSIAPAIRKGEGYSEQKALVLSVHGASVEARNQARAYKSKDWVDIVAATNRRPYGFGWEEWGRIDALEVLEEAKRVFKPEESHIYLTGHSMGGHGTWYLGTTYPDKFAAIAPCASYPDVLNYGSSRGDVMHQEHPAFKMIQRGGNPGRTLTLVPNLLQSGVYIFHGDADRVVPLSQAQMMRDILGKFHPDFCYYEYPGGEHWFGDHSVDWFPIFDYFKWHSIPAYKDVKSIDFTTASPAVSPTDYWITVEQQVYPYAFTNVKAVQNGDTIAVEKADNVALLTLDIPSLEIKGGTATVQIGGQALQFSKGEKARMALRNGTWEKAGELNLKHKYPARSGGFKQAYTNRAVFVYGTKGTAAENAWNQNKARFDAETFTYRGNGSFEVIADKDYTPAKYAGRNVVLYGNSQNNTAWASLLKNCPVQVRKGEITVGGKSYKGDDLGTYFIYPNPHDNTTSVGVVAGTGTAGNWATSPNNYFYQTPGFPDVMVFRAGMLKDGLPEVEAAGFFDNDWTVKADMFSK